MGVLNQAMRFDESRLESGGLGFFFAELTATSAVLLGVALAAAAVKLPGAIEARPRIANGVRLVGCLVPLAVAVTLAARAFAAAMAEQAADPYW